MTRVFLTSPFLLAVCWILAASATAQSRIDCNALNSRILKRSVHYCVYLPSGYDDAASLHPARRQGLDHARAVYGLADARLGDRKWALGDGYSIADIHLFRLFWRFRGWLGADPEYSSGYGRTKPRKRKT